MRKFALKAVSSILTFDKTAAQRPDRDRIVVTVSTTVTKRDITVVLAAATWRHRLTLDCRPAESRSRKGRSSTSERAWLMEAGNPARFAMR